MPSKSYGPTVKARALRLFKALLLFAKGELDDCFTLDVACRWDDKAGNKLVVQTKLRVLEVLVSRDGEAGTLTKPQIRESLYRMQDFLHILEDNRPIKQGKEEWHFTLKLWSSDIAANVQKFDQTWESSRSQRSKSQERARVTAAPPVPPRMRPTGGVPFQVPPLPAHFVERPEVSDALKASLFSAETSQTGVLVVSAIYGLGGIGKSTLAAALAGDEEVYRRFPDGVLWATLGQQPDLLSFLSSWIQALRDYDFKPTTAEAAKMHLQTLLADKAALLVVDDVWNAEHFEFFRVGNGNCRLLVTTREAPIRGATRYELDVMAPQQALELLRRSQGGVLGTGDEALARELAKTVGYLPLALELAAAQVADGVSWQELLADLTREIALLEALDLPGAEAIESESLRKRYSLLACFNLSLQRLSAIQLQRFAWLGVLPEDVSLTPQLGMTLWELEERQARQVLREFKARALLLLGISSAEGMQIYRLHDLLHDIARRLLTVKVMPGRDGLPGLGLTLAEAHAQLLERYRAKTEEGLWHTLADDGYIHAYLSWHLVKAGWVEELHQLLQEETEAGRNGWYEACDALGRLGVFVQDVARGWEEAEKAFEASPSRSMALQCRYALIMSSVNNLVGNIPAELMATLVDKGVWTPAQGLAYARQVQDPRDRANTLKVLAPHLPKVLFSEVLKTIPDKYQRATVLSSLAPQRPELLPEALEAARAIRDKYQRARVLSSLTSQRPELLPEALETARAIQSNYKRARVLSSLTPQLPELLSKALETARAIQSKYQRARVLIRLTPQEPELLPEALETARAIQSKYQRVRVLSILAAQLPELLSEALEIARAIQDESDRARVLSILAAQLPELLPEALETVRAIQSESNRATILSSLAAQFTKLLPEAWETALAIQSESDRAIVLSSLAPQLPEALLPEAWETALAIQSEPDRTKVLSSLAPQLPEALLPEALETARAIQSNYQRAKVLSSLAPQLPELFPEALRTAFFIQDESNRATILSSLALQLPEALLTLALVTTGTIQSKYQRAKVLSSLAPQLPKLFPEALETARAIPDASDRAKVLSSLAPQLPELFPEALETARAIEAEFNRATILSSLAPQLPETLLLESLNAAREIRELYYRANAFSCIAGELKRLPANFSLWQEIIHTLVCRGRKDFLEDLAKLVPVIITLGGSESLPEIARAIQDVGRQWP